MPPGAASATAARVRGSAGPPRGHARIEGVCEDAGLYAGIVDLSSFSVVNCFLAGGRVPTGDWLVVHMRSDYTSIVIMRGGDVIFFRKRAEGDGDPFADLVHQTTMYYQDRLSGQGFRACWWAAPAAGTDVEVARRGLETAWARRSTDRPDAARAPDRSADEAPRTSGVWRRSSACCCGPGRKPRPPDAAHQPLHPAVLQRSRGARVLSGCRRHRSLATAFNVVELAADDGAEPQRRRGVGRNRGGAADAGSGAGAAGSTRPSSTRCRRPLEGSQRDHRPAGVLVDDAVRAVRVGAPADVRITAVQPRRETDGTFAVSVGCIGAAGRGRGRLHRGAGGAGHVQGRAARGGADHRGGSDRGGARRPVFPEAPAGGTTLLLPGKEPAPRCARCGRRKSSPMTEILSPLVVRVASENKRGAGDAAGRRQRRRAPAPSAIYTLSQRVANVSDRSTSAAHCAGRGGGEQYGHEHSGRQDQAVTELAAFTTSVLPRDPARAPAG